MRWLRSWWQAWKLARLARDILESPEASDAAMLNARTILTALAARRPLCRQCFQPYDVKPRPFGEIFRVRSILLIPDCEPDPMLCDSCFDNAAAVFNPHATNVGTSNNGPINLVLRKSA